MTKSVVTCRFGHIYWRNPSWKTSFFVQCWVKLFTIRKTIYVCLLAEKALYILKTFRSHARLKLAKNQAKAKQYPEVKLLLSENYSLSSFTLSSKNNRYSKKCAKNRIRLKMKNWSHAHDINRPRLRHGHKYTKYKICLTTMMVMCIKQHLSNISSSIHEKVQQHWGWVEKKRCL